MRLYEAEKNKPYAIDGINAREEGMGEFLFTLGCFPDEEITVISQVSTNYIINVKDARYSIDENLAAAIDIRERESRRQVI